MTRIVAGLAGGLRLATPSGSGTRPTSERVREALFSRLTHLEAVSYTHLDVYKRQGRFVRRELVTRHWHALFFLRT